MSLGEYLRNRRETYWDFKIPLASMAHKVGCTKSYLWNVEAGKSEPSLRMAVKIAKAYQISLTRMVRFLEPPVS